MILVDSSVWIDFLSLKDTPQTATLWRAKRAREPIGIADVVLTEVLQGTRSDADFATARRLFATYLPVTTLDFPAATRAAQHYRILRAKGITIRKTIDTLIATRCILDDIPLLFTDRDFYPFVEHLGLRSALHMFPE